MVRHSGGRSVVKSKCEVCVCVRLGPGGLETADCSCQICQVVLRVLWADCRVMLNARLEWRGRVLVKTTS